ncbi:MULTISPECIES: hypothetical protein [Actinomadura]|jgi:hypothetical protein|uniref:Uncharacterized protein n=1 Tax=Actinomadura geliboluensis TaxID=882440 RepID=A0A5S4G338_9ACTN|nr:hypothetical protein [Actinomadura geliboluensis]TMR27427.1 hypothetical protein ETD96_39415 [Actinomadura geliboluensis]
MRRETLAALALVPVLALGVQGCGGGKQNAAASGTGKAAGDDQKMREFAQCMRENGVDMPDPKNGRVEIRSSAKPGGGGPDTNGKVEAAQKKCAHLMPNGGKPKKPDPEQLAKMRAFSKCMRDHGVTGFPDPEPDGRMLVEGKEGTEMDPEGATFQAAQKACAKYQPERRVSGGTSGGE